MLTDLRPGFDEQVYMLRPRLQHRFQPGPAVMASPVYIDRHLQSVTASRKLHINGQLAICSSAPPASLISLGFFLGIAWSTRCRREEEIEIIACHWPYTSEHHEKSPPALPSNYPTLRPLQRLLNFTGKTKTTSSFSLTVAFILTLKQ
jgi:hypothetical protein